MVRGQLVPCDLEARKPLGRLNTGLRTWSLESVRESELNSVALRWLLLLLLLSIIIIIIIITLGYFFFKFENKVDSNCGWPGTRCVD